LQNESRFLQDESLFSELSFTFAEQNETKSVHITEEVPKKFNYDITL